MRSSERRSEPHPRGWPITFDKFSFSVGPTGNHRVLDAIDLEIPGGAFVGVVGQNGSGKSSLLSAIAGELDPASGVATSGQVLVGGHIVNRPVGQIVDGIGVVHQDDRQDLLVHLSVAQNISIRQQLGRGKGTHFFDQTWSNRWFREEREQLSEFSFGRMPPFHLDDIVGTLSGGQRQLLSVYIASRREHALNPCRVLVLDEHTAKLDHRNAEDVLESTETVVRESGCTCVMISHRYDHVLRSCSYIVVVGGGRVEMHSRASVRDDTHLRSLVESVGT